MLSRAAVRASSTTSMVARRGFHSTRAQMSSPYHYPEGPRSNIPFNPLTKFFAFRYWTFMAVGFGKLRTVTLARPQLTYDRCSLRRCGLANIQEPVNREVGLWEKFRGCRILEDIDREKGCKWIVLRHRIEDFSHDPTTSSWVFCDIRLET